MTVGRSWRTVAKHALMRNLLGQEVGVVNKWKNKGEHVPSSVWYDLTAGDGVAPDDTAWGAGCSPGIVASYARDLRVPTTVLLSEIQAATYDRLIVSLAENLPRLGYEPKDEFTWTFSRSGVDINLHALNMSGWDASVDIIERDAAVFVLNDPNAITEWAMRPSFAQEIRDRTWRSRSLSTMGCNPAGLKRLDLSERMGWFGLVKSQQDALPVHRDLLLTAIERDDAQWAYLIGQAAKWREGTESKVRSAFAQAGRTAAMSWYVVDREGFEATKDRLFFTKQELREFRSDGLW